MGFQVSTAQKTDNRAGQAFRQAAAAVMRSDTAFDAFYRRKKGHIGPQQAQVATAHKIARTVYALLKNRRQYHDIGAEADTVQQRDRDLAYLKRKAAKLGYVLTATAEIPTSVGVSP